MGSKLCPSDSLWELGLEMDQASLSEPETEVRDLGGSAPRPAGEQRVTDVQGQPAWVLVALLFLVPGLGEALCVPALESLPDTPVCSPIAPPFTCAVSVTCKQVNTGLT